MSTNLHLVAKRKVIVCGTGKEDYQTEKVDLWQTPTEISLKAIRSGNPQEEYFNWVCSISEDQTENIYVDDDPFDMQDPVDVVCYNIGDQHIQDLKAHIWYLEEQGYELEWTAW